MRKLVASCSAVLIAITVLTACGGGSSKPKVSTNPLAPGSTDKTGNGGNGSSSDLAALYAAASKQKFKITYAQEDGGSLTLAQDGKGASASITDGATTITKPDKTISCTKDSSSGTTQCVEQPSTGLAGLGPFAAFFTQAQAYIGLANLGRSSSKTIADRSAQCVTIAAKDYIGKLGAAVLGAAGKGLKASSTVCVDKKTGALLEFGGTDDTGKQTTTLVATEVGEPSDSDFTPPVTPETLPSIPTVSLPPGVSIPGQ